MIRSRITNVIANIISYNVCNTRYQMTRALLVLWIYVNVSTLQIISIDCVRFVNLWPVVRGLV